MTVAEVELLPVFPVLGVWMDEGGRADLQAGVAVLDYDDMNLGVASDAASVLIEADYFTRGR